ncbi:hypothetical protein VTN77DRAFT_4840 [Rasamsonia byssochlamydoides]|uniref:uncharacterized protein n=1 Tax=Rasamsonia byssochlamydoides TaxID=89139 RepID=UPI0037449572
MVTTRSQTATSGSEASPGLNSSDTVNGKRKGRPISSGNADGQSNKRRKRESLALSEKPDSPEIPETQDVNGGEKTDVVDGVESTPEGEPQASQKQEEPAEKPASSTKKSNHIRFGSEEPADAEPVVEEEVAETQQQDEQDSESDDDEAPEAIDNAAQLKTLKAQAQRQEEARKRAELLKKEKRRQLDEKHKLQAKASGKKTKESSVGSRTSELKSAQDDSVSESTATLQGSISKDSGRLALPALLPDEILNAEPVARPPTPPSESDDLKRKKPQKLKFLEKVEKPPKDLHRGGVTIRVLEDRSSSKKTTPTLPPKMSKAGRNIREAWIAGQRNKNNPNGLRRIAGGPSSFVRSR